MFQKKNGYNKMHVTDVMESIFSAWLRRYKVVFFILFFGICIWGVFVWYYSLYYFHWSDEQKQTYINSQSHWTSLNTKDFEDVLRVLDSRNDAYTSGSASVKNIFMTDSNVKQN